MLGHGGFRSGVVGSYGRAIAPLPRYYVLAGTPENSVTLSLTDKNLRVLIFPPFTFHLSPFTFHIIPLVSFDNWSSLDGMKFPSTKSSVTALLILVSPVIAHRAYSGNKRHENYRNGLRSVLNEDRLRPDRHQTRHLHPIYPAEHPLYYLGLLSLHWLKSRQACPPRIQSLYCKPSQRVFCETMSSGLHFSQFSPILILRSSAWSNSSHPWGTSSSDNPYRTRELSTPRSHFPN
jgi:hypothetical protein